MRIMRLFKVRVTEIHRHCSHDEGLEIPISRDELNFSCRKIFTGNDLVFQRVYHKCCICNEDLSVGKVKVYRIIDHKMNFIQAISR